MYPELKKRKSAILDATDTTCSIRDLTHPCSYMSSEDGFVLVTRGRRKHRNKTKKNLRRDITPENATQEYEVNYEVEHLFRTLRNTFKFKDTSIIKFLSKHLKKSLTTLESNDISEIVCYGLGQFSQSRSSRYQLAFLLYLKVRYSNARVHVYDPAFRPEEKQILRDLGLEIIERNEEGKRVLHRDRTTLVFMPHCPRELMNNFLYANWGERLSNCILLSNSFSKIIDDVNCLREETLIRLVNYIYRIQPCVTEIQLDNLITDEHGCSYQYAFNSMSIHIFPKKDLLKVPTDFWNCREEPQYLNCKGEMIQCKYKNIK